MDEYPDYPFFLLLQYSLPHTYTHYLKRIVILLKISKSKVVLIYFGVQGITYIWVSIAN